MPLFMSWPENYGQPQWKSHKLNFHGEICGNLLKPSSSLAWSNLYRPCYNYLWMVRSCIFIFISLLKFLNSERTIPPNRTRIMRWQFMMTDSSKPHLGISTKGMKFQQDFKTNPVSTTNPTLISMVHKQQIPTNKSLHRGGARTSCFRFSFEYATHKSCIVYF